MTSLLMIGLRTLEKKVVVGIKWTQFQNPERNLKTFKWYICTNASLNFIFQWQRAAFCRNFILNHIKGETYKGTKLWTTKQIMLWCRLHAFSPHYLGNYLQGRLIKGTNSGLNKQIMKIRNRISLKYIEYRQYYMY